MEKKLILGPAGEIELALHMSLSATADFLLVCHPHPLYGGTMDNKVVTTIAKTYLDLGINVVRFNYRGVGNSQGEYGDITGEVKDGSAVIKWLQSQFQVERIFLAGFSFGAYIAAKQVELFASSSLVFPHILLVAPSVEHSPFNELGDLPAATTVIMGGLDEIVPFEAVSDWVANQNPKPEMITFEQATHFFHGQLINLKKQIKSTLAAYV